MADYSEAVAKAIEGAVHEAQEKGNTEVTENHLLKQFVAASDGYFVALLEETRGNVAELMDEIAVALDKLAVYSESQKGPPRASQGLSKLLFEAGEIAKAWKDSYISSDHFLISFAKNGSEPFARWLKKSGVDQKGLEAIIKKMRGERTMDTPTAESQFKVLEKYCKNLTALAKEGSSIL